MVAVLAIMLVHLLESAVRVPPVLLVSFDGMRADYITSGRADTPNFDMLRKEGCTVAPGITPSFVSKTFPNHWTLVTGRYEESHGIVANSMFDPRYPGEVFTMSNTEEKWWNRAEPIWRSAQKQGRKVATLFWPGSETPHDGKLPDYFFHYNGSMPFNQRVDKVVEWLTLPEPDRPDFITLYFEEPDHSGHLFGPDSGEVSEAIRKADDILGELKRRLEAVGAWDSLNMVVTADHGMASISPSRVVTLSEYVDTSLFTLSDTSPVSAVWPSSDDPAVLQSLRDSLDAAPHVSAYLKHELPARLHYSRHVRIAPLLVLAQEGWSIRLDEAAPLPTDRGAHGYDNALPSMHPIFVARGPSFRRGYSVNSTFENVHVHSLLAAALALQPELLPSTNGSLFVSNSGGGGTGSSSSSSSSSGGAPTVEAGTVEAGTLLQSPGPHDAQWLPMSNRRFVPLAGTVNDTAGAAAAGKQDVWYPRGDRVTVVPVDGAHFLGGSIFDLQVLIPQTVWTSHSAHQAAVSGAPSSSSAAFVTVRIDGQSAEKFCNGHNSNGRRQQQQRKGQRKAASASVISLSTANITTTEYHVLDIRTCQMPELPQATPSDDHSAGRDIDVIVALGGRDVQKLTWRVRAPTRAGARNVILIVGDGMSLPMISAARVAAGSATQQNGKLTHTFATDKMEHIGLVRTNSLEALVTDSAASASAYNTGHKTVDGSTGVYPDATTDVTAVDYTKDLDNPRVETLPEYLRRRDPHFAIGVATTASVVDATPAALWGHSSNRHRSTQLAAQALELPGGPVDVILGGGGSAFDGSNQEKDQHPPSMGALAEDEFVGGHGFVHVTTATELEDAVSSSTAPAERLLGLFSNETMSTYIDRHLQPLREAEGGVNLEGHPEQPGLQQMALSALDVLHRKAVRGGSGFYLMVEGASIDKQAHACDTHRMLTELIELQQTIGAVLEWVKEHAPDTLVVVTSDHSTGGFDVYGSIDTDGWNGAGNDTNSAEETEQRLGTIRKYGHSRWPDYRDTDGDGMPDTFTEAQHNLAGMNNNHPGYIENFQLKKVSHWLYEESTRQAVVGLNVGTNIGAQAHTSSSSGKSIHSPLVPIAKPHARVLLSSAHASCSSPLFMRLTPCSLLCHLPLPLKRCILLPTSWFLRRDQGPISSVGRSTTRKSSSEWLQQ
jgi:alkaline phosphatase/predicted AlkP superfamily pyrophosphatase or phosphodiesterase